MTYRFASIAIALALFVASAVGVQGIDATNAASSDLSFEIFKDAKKEYRWRLRAGNGKVIGMADEGYARKDACQHAITLIQEGAAKAKVEDHSTKD